MEMIEAEGYYILLRSCSRLRDLLILIHQTMSFQLPKRFVFFVCGLFIVSLPNLSAADSSNPYSKKVLVEDFNKPHRKSPSGSNYYGAFADNKSLGSCYVFFYGGTDKVLSGDGYSMHLQWDVSQPGAFGGYWNRLQHINLENFNYLTFYVRGFFGGEVFKIGLRGTENAEYETKILITGVLKNGVTTSWQKVIIPLRLFRAIENWGDISIFSINFEHAFDSGKGQILIDDIEFEK